MFGFKTNKDRLIQRLQAENAVLKRHIDILKAEVEYEKSTTVQVTWKDDGRKEAGTVQAHDNVTPIRKTAMFLGRPIPSEGAAIVPRSEMQDLSDY